MAVVAKPRLMRNGFNMILFPYSCEYFILITNWKNEEWLWISCRYV